MSRVARNPETLKGRVLVIDDDTATLMVLAKAFNREAYDVETASSAREALARLTRSDFDVIISDIRMPEFDGRQLFAFIEDHFPDYRSRVVFLTGDASPETLKFIGDSGAVHFTKPPDLRELLEVIGAMVRRNIQPAGEAVVAAPPPPILAAASGQQVTRLSVEAAQLRREIADREREIAALTARLDRSSHEIAAARLQSTTTTEELNGLRDEVAEKERELSRVTRRLGHVEAQAKSEQETLRAELERLRGLLAQMATDLETHRSEAARRGAEVQALRGENARLEAEMEAHTRESARTAAELQARLRIAEAVSAQARQAGGGVAAAAAPAQVAVDTRAAEMEEILAEFYRAVVRPLTIASAHLEMAVAGNETLDAETVVELHKSTTELKQRLSELAHGMELLGIRLRSS